MDVIFEQFYAGVVGGAGFACALAGDAVARTYWGKGRVVGGKGTAGVKGGKTKDAGKTDMHD